MLDHKYLQNVSKRKEKKMSSKDDHKSIHYAKEVSCRKLHIVIKSRVISTMIKSSNIFLKNHIEVCSPHLCASFGTFYVQIGQSFESQ